MRRRLSIVSMWLCLLSAGLWAQRPLVETPPDFEIVPLLDAISADGLARTVPALAALGTRNTLSSDRPTRGVKAAREWIYSQFVHLSPRPRVSYDAYRVAARGPVTTRARFESGPAARREATPGRLVGAASTQAPAPPTPSQADIDRWRAYHVRLVSVTQKLRATASLSDVLGPLFSLVRDRAGDGEIADEARAALWVMTVYVNGWPVETVTPEARTWPRAARRTISLRDRSDLAKHFTISAVIAAFAGSPVADLVGVFKEMRDLQGTSGFSFSDIAADRAGATLGEVLTAKTLQSRAVVTHIVGGVTEDDFIPAIAGLPDNLTRAELERRFGGVGGAGYTSIVDDINRRVAALPLFRERAVPAG